MSAVKKGLQISGIVADDAAATSYLKSVRKSEKPKQSPTLAPGDIVKAFKALSDDDFIHVKLAVLLQIFGGLRREAANSLTIGSIEWHDSFLKINLSGPSKTDTAGFGRVFFCPAVPIEDHVINVVRIFDRYKLRVPEPLPQSALFRQLHLGWFTRQKSGNHFFDKLASRRAQVVALEYWSTFTNHCFRRTGTT